MEDFSIPLPQETIPLLSPKKANDEAFYATANSGTTDIVGTFNTARTDLEQKGQSDFVDGENAKWNSQVEQETKQVVTGILEDNTISPQLKKAILQSYSLTGTVASTLKDRYIQKTAAAEVGNTLADKESQDGIIETLPQRVINNEKNITKETIHAGKESMYAATEYWTQPLKAIASAVLLSIPAGLAGLYQVIKEQSQEEADKIMQTIQSHAYKPTDETAKETLKTMLSAAETLGIPAKIIGNFGLKTTGSPLVATAAEIILDPINYIPLGLLAKNKKSLLTVKSDTPLATTAAANPKAAQNLAVSALKDPTDKIAAAVGADKGTIVHDWVLPKIFPNDVAKAHPDLTAEIAKADTNIRETFASLRYDPNIINATKREEEVSKIFNIITESRTPYYNQSMSLINETDELFEGSAIFSRNGGYGYKREKDALAAHAKLKESIDNLPPEHQGTLSVIKQDGEFFVNWKWKKEYDDVSSKIFSKDAIQTTVLGRDVSNLARSGVGRWLFPTGRFPQWLEFGALRGIERSAGQREALTKTIRDNISNTKHGKELDYLIREAEEKGIDYFSPKEISGLFPKLSSKQAEDLFVTHTWWRRQQQYNHNFMNREHRHRLLKDDMQGMYDKAGNYLGPATSKVGPKEIEDIREVFDLDTNMVVKFDPIANEKFGKTLVRLNEKVSGQGEVHHYGLVGGNVKLDLLPNEVLARLPGYSGRRVKESFFVTSIPKSLVVNGLTKSSPTGLREYAKTKAAARTEAEGNKIAEELRANNPDDIIEVRPERSENWGKVLTDYQIHQEFLQHSMKRGARLPSVDAPARLEDRMLTLLNTTNSISRMGAFRAWDDALQSAFVKRYSEFTKGQFPQYATDIKPLENMGRDLKQEYDNAHAMFKYYERMKNNETRGDFLWTKGLHAIADILEKWKIPAGALRGNHQNPLMFAKTVATVGYIHMAPIRQWLIQPVQQLEMYALNPSTAAKNFANTMAIRMYIGADSQMIKKSGGSEIIKFNAKKAGELAGNKEFLDDVEAIRKSGLLQSVDMNSIVHGVFKEVDRNLVENVPEKIWKDIETSVKAIPRLSRAAGFDAAELTNRVGNWLQVKDLWKVKNPGKNWKSKEALEQISAEASRLSGAMNRAGALPYQEGMLSPIMQFVAINQKMLMNLIQDNATILTKEQRARLAAVRLGLYGAKYGIPGGAIAYHFIEKSDNEEVKKYAEQIKRGAIDSAANRMLAAVVEPDEKPDVAVSKALSPYSEGFHPYFAVMWEMTKLFDDKPANPRYPAFGMISSFGLAIEDMQGWWITREVNEENFSQMAMEAAEVASGFNSYSQGLLMLGMRDKVTKAGNKYGMQFTASEAYTKMITGFSTAKEEDLWKLVELERDTKSQKAEMAKIIYRQMSNQRNKLSEDDYALKVQRLNSFISLLDPTHFSEADKLDVINEVEKLDKKNYTTIKESILVEHFKYHLEKRTQEWKQVDDILRRLPDPEVQKYIKAIDEGNL